MKNFLARTKSRLFSLLWWKAAALRGLYTAVAVTIPYLGGALLSDIAWLTAASAAGLGFLASVMTSLAGLPEAEGVDLPWWLAAVERVTKTFAQALGAGFLGATLLTDVPWSTVIQAALIASLLSLLRLILATLPADPTPNRNRVDIAGHVTVNAVGPVDVLAERPIDVTGQTAVPGVDVEQVTDLSSERRYPLG